MILEPDDFQHLPRPVLKMSSTHPVECPVKADQPFSAAVVECNAFRKKTHPAARGRMTKTFSKQMAIAARRPHETHSQVNGGTFAGTVWSEETENFSSLHGQAEAVESTQTTFAGEAAILFGNIAELKREGHRRLF
jgi:hypothetical protein